MPRYARIHVTGGLFHIISRFHDRRYYLDIEGAREKYLDLLGKAVETHDGRIIAYCLMSTHIHLVMQLGSDPIGLLARKVHGPFGAWINKKRGGLGTILADRPKSVLVHSEMYGMEQIRYVHNNPVRAGVVSRASESDWSSHCAYLGLNACPSWLSTDAVFGPDETERETIRRELADYIDEGRGEARRPEFSGEVPRELARRIRKLLGGEVELSYPVLGPDDFVVSAIKGQVKKNRDGRRSRECAADAREVIAAVFETLGMAPELAWKRVKAPQVSRGRALVAWLWVERMGRPQVIVADAMAVRRTAVSKMLAKLRREGLRSEEESVIEEVFERLTGEVTPTESSTETADNGIEPRVIVLRRNREK
jgi:REP element-mobilizing transposase RayT